MLFYMAGDGKTHYIKGQLSRSPLCCIIAVNEAFTPLSAIRKLRHLPSEQPDCAIFFNFTLLLSGGESSSKIVKVSLDIYERLNCVPCHYGIANYCIISMKWNQ